MGGLPDSPAFETPPVRPSAEVATPTLLGLYMLLLAFFILLVSMSTRVEHRANAVIEAVGTTFNSRPATGDGRAAMVVPAGEAATLGFLPEAGRLVAAAIPLARVDQLREGRHLRLSVPASELFASGAATLLPEAETLLRQIAALLAGRPAGMRFDVEFLAGRDKDGDLAAAASRAAAVVRALQATGAPADSLAAGIVDGDGRTAIFSFFVREAQVRRAGESR
ncbi:MAG: hypothetical protein HY057_02910 [Rhodospirillales bacterium]|nr:hypothetical protein [Rhodospirillales bacterium]